MRLPIYRSFGFTCQDAGAALLDARWHLAIQQLERAADTSQEYWPSKGYGAGGGRGGVISEYFNINTLYDNMALMFDANLFVYRNSVSLTNIRQKQLSILDTFGSSESLKP